MLCSLFRKFTELEGVTHETLTVISVKFSTPDDLKLATYFFELIYLYK